MAESEHPIANGANSFKANAATAFHSVANGPVLQNVKAQHVKTSTEFSNLAAARKTPSHQAATGQTLTHYHSFFMELISWNNPRASAIAYLSIVTLIFAARYLDFIRYAFKLTWMVLGVTVAAEVAGKTLLGNGFATQIRPRQYYLIPRETLEAVIGDVHELINFFVIEVQRILFAENVPASAAAALAAFVSYYLVMIMPYWGLSLIFTTVTFLVPPLYTSNQELIDEKLRRTTRVISAQTSQLREVASKHTAQATNLTKQYMGDYTHKAQNLLGRQLSPGVETKPATTISDAHFPKVPEHEPGQYTEKTEVKGEPLQVA